LFALFPLFSLHSHCCILCICFVALIRTFSKFACSYFAAVSSFIALLFRVSLFNHCAFMLYMYKFLLTFRWCHILFLNVLYPCIHVIPIMYYVSGFLR
jgi:hypothetical protein